MSGGRRFKGRCYIKNNVEHLSVILVSTVGPIEKVDSSKITITGITGGGVTPSPTTAKDPPHGRGDVFRPPPRHVYLIPRVHVLHTHWRRRSPHQHRDPGIVPVCLLHMLVDT